jgi:hypothetical protein
MKSTAAIGVLWLAVVAPAATLPERVLPAGVGINIHFTRGHEQDLDLMAAGGFRVARMDFSWAGTERQKGSYDWSAYDELTGNLEKRGIRPYYILDYSNSLYEETVSTKNPVSGEEQRDTASPQHPESVAAFAQWAAAAVRHYRGHPILWEIWNEPNITFWKPKPDVRQYTTLALATCQAIRGADPQAILVAPSTSGFPWEFLEEFFRSGVLAQLDAVSVHPYRDYRRGPETAAEDYRRLRGLIARHSPAAGKSNLPILSGEWGYASHTKGVDLETQAAFLVRQQLANLLNEIPVSIWYDWKNDGPDPAEREHNFGTVTPNLQPKPAYTAVRTLTRELGGYRVLGRLRAGDESDYVLLLVNAEGDQKLAAWTTGQPHTLGVPLVPGSKETKAEVLAGDGALATDAKIAHDRLMLDLAAPPQFVRLGALRTAPP